MDRQNAKAVIESILFTMGESVELTKLAEVLEEEADCVKEIIQEMKEEYGQAERGIQIVELQDSYQLCSKRECYEYLIRIAKAPKKNILTEALLETLSIVAYKQPVTRLEIEKIRGVSCGHTINKLVEFNLIMEVGRLDAPGRPLLFGTTEEFLRSFGVKSIADLPVPDPERVEDFKQEAEQEVQKSISV